MFLKPRLRENIFLLISRSSPLEEATKGGFENLDTRMRYFHVSKNVLRPKIRKTQITSPGSLHGCKTMTCEISCISTDTPCPPPQLLIANG